MKHLTVEMDLRKFMENNKAAILEELKSMPEFIEQEVDNSVFTPASLIGDIIADVAPNSERGRATKVERLRSDFKKASDSLKKAYRLHAELTDELRAEEKKLEHARSTSAEVQQMLGGYSREVLYTLLDAMFKRVKATLSIVFTADMLIEDLEGVMADEGLYEDIINAAGGELIFYVCKPMEIAQERAESEGSTAEERDIVMSFVGLSDKHRHSNKKHGRKFSSRMRRPEIRRQLAAYGKKIDLSVPDRGWRG